MEIINREKFSGFTRRTAMQMLGMSWLAFATAGSLVLSGCAYFSDISGWISVGLSSVQSVVDLLTGAGGISIPIGGAVDLVIKLLKAALADIGTAVTAYNNAPAADKATFLGKLGTAIMVAQNQLAQFWNDLTIPDPQLASTIAGLLGIIASTLAYFQTQAPAPVGAALHPFNKKLSFAATKRTPKDFKRDFNLILGDKYAKYHI